MTTIKTKDPVVDFWQRYGTFTNELITVVEVDGERHLINGLVTQADIDAVVDAIVSERK